MTTASIILDIVCLAIIGISVAYCWHRGFFASLLDVSGMIIALIVSYVAANKLSPVVFERFFRNSMYEKTVETLGEQAGATLTDVLNKILSFLPDGFLQYVSQGQISLEGPTEQVATVVVDQVVKPIVVPFIALILFLLVFIVLRIVISILGRLLKEVNKIPLLGTANKVAGGAIGIVLGLVYVAVAIVIVWVFDVANGGGEGAQSIFSGSIAYRLFSQLNFFG